MQAVGLALPRREPYFRRSRISQKPRAMQIYLLRRGVNRVYCRLKRVKYLQIPNCQLFKKTQLAFNHVHTPLKSELNFYKSLIFNNLTKFNSLQTLSVYFSPHSQLLFLQHIDNQYFTKITPARGYLRKYPKPAYIFTTY